MSWHAALSSSDTVQDCDSVTDKWTTNERDETAIGPNVIYLC